MIPPKREIMKRATFNMLPSQIERLTEVTAAVQEVENQDINKSEVFREALNRGLDSILAQVEAKKEHKNPPED